MSARENLHLLLAEGKANLRQTSREFIEGFDIREFVALFVFIPVFLLAVEGVIRSDFWLFAAVTRGGFAQHLIGRPLFSLNTLAEAYLSSIAHSGWHHLKSNLTAYVIAMTAFYPMAILTRQKRKVAFLFVLILIVGPLFITVMNFRNPMGARTIGFSGLVSSYFGLLPVLMFAAVDARIEADFNPFWACSVMFLVYGSMFAYLGNLPEAAAMGVLVAILLGMYLFMEGLEAAYEAFRVLTGIDFYFFPWALAVAYLGTLGMYYQLPPGTNVVGHVAGYIFGFLCGFIAFGTAPTGWLRNRWT